MWLYFVIQLTFLAPNTHLVFLGDGRHGYVAYLWEKIEFVWRMLVQRLEALIQCCCLRGSGKHRNSCHSEHLFILRRTQMRAKQSGRRLYEAYRG
ncbi:hypothetical protein F5Y10DRAFT_253246 [Nemania abortiva]|nr:hypothetical protein F5Y10DRAFT_253246 [Nemania abortiva]